MQLCMTSAFAIPLFARKYSVSCFTCHISPPLLNDFGRRFQANGYNLPGSGSDQQAQYDQATFPLALLSQPMVAHTISTDDLAAGKRTTTTVFSGLELALFSSGSLGPHFSYFAETPVIHENGETSIEVVDAHLLYTNVLNDGLGSLNIKFGKMRAFVPFIANTIFSNADPLAYNYTAISGTRKAANDLNIFQPSFGLSAFGILPQVEDGLRWEAGITAGTKNTVDIAAANAGFFALNQTVYLKNAPMRMGAFYYYGKERIVQSPDSTTWFNNLSKIGVDIEVYDPWIKRVILFGQALYAVDHSIDNHGTKQTMKGGFIGINSILIAETLFAFARFDYVETDFTASIERQLDAGLRWNLLSNVILTMGCTASTEFIPRKIDRNTISVSGGILFGF